VGCHYIDKGRITTTFLKKFLNIELEHSPRHVLWHSKIKMAVLGRWNYVISRQLIQKINPEIAYIGYIGCVSVFPIKALQSLNIPVVHHLGNNFFVKMLIDCILEESTVKRFWRKMVFGFYSLKECDFRNIITNK